MRGELGGVAVKEMTHVLKPHESQAVSGARTRVLELWKVVASPTATKITSLLRRGCITQVLF